MTTPQRDGLQPRALTLPCNGQQAGAIRLHNTNMIPLTSTTATPTMAPVTRSLLPICCCTARATATGSSRSRVTSSWDMPLANRLGLLLGSWAGCCCCCCWSSCSCCSCCFTRRACWLASSCSQTCKRIHVGGSEEIIGYGTEWAGGAGEAQTPRGLPGGRVHSVVVVHLAHRPSDMRCRCCKSTTLSPCGSMQLPYSVTSLPLGSAQSAIVLRTRSAARVGTLACLRPSGSAPLPTHTAALGPHLHPNQRPRGFLSQAQAVALNTHSAGACAGSPLHAYAHLGQRKAHPRTQPRSCPTCTPASALVTGSTSCRSRAATASAACCRRSSLPAPPVPPPPTPSWPPSMPLAPSPAGPNAAYAFACNQSKTRCRQVSQRRALLTRQAGRVCSSRCCRSAARAALSYSPVPLCLPWEAAQAAPRPCRRQTWLTTHVQQPRVESWSGSVVRLDLSQHEAVDSEMGRLLTAQAMSEGPRTGGRERTKTAQASERA